MNKQLTSIAVGLVLISLISCGKRQTTTVFDQPENPGAVNYEKVWVNPSIVASDTLFTLVKAERLDSILVENIDGTISERGDVISFSFHIDLASCKTNIYLTDSYNQEVMRLYQADLPTGYYRFNCDRSRINIEGLQYSDLFVKITYCARSVIQKLDNQL